MDRCTEQPSAFPQGISEQTDSGLWDTTLDNVRVIYCLHVNAGKKSDKYMTNI